MKAAGYAIVQHGEIDVRTVSPTRRAAIVNWLCVGPRVIPMNDWSDARIEAAWERERERMLAENRPRVIAVTIEEST